MEEESKKKSKFLLVLLILAIITCVIGIVIIYTPNFRATKKAVVVKVEENSLGVMNLDGTSLCSVSFAKEGNIGFKQGQEVFIYFNGVIASSFPEQIHHVGKIKIVKEKSDITIPESILRYYYSSRKNVTVSIDKLTNKEISFSIKDTNELPYEYSNQYAIYKKNKQAEENIPIDQNQIIPATQNTTSSYLRTYTSNTNMGRNTKSFTNRK